MGHEKKRPSYMVYAHNTRILQDHFQEDIDGNCIFSALQCIARGSAPIREAIEQIDNLKALSEAASQLSDSMAIMTISSAIRKQDPTLKVVWWSRCYGIVQVQREKSFTGDSDVRTTQVEIDSTVDFSSNEIEKVVVLRSHEMHSANGERARTLWRAYACSWVCGTQDCKYTGLYHDLEKHQKTCPMSWMRPGGNSSGSGSGAGGGGGSGGGSGTGSGSGAGGGSGSGKGSGTGGGSGSSKGSGTGGQHDSSKKARSEHESEGYSRTQRNAPEVEEVEEYCARAQEKRKQFKKHCCELSATGNVCSTCKESMQPCNSSMRKLLDATDSKLNCGAELSKIQQKVYQLPSSPNMRKTFDAAEAPTKRKKTKVEEDDRDEFRDVCCKVIELDQTRVVYQTRELDKTEDVSATMVFHDTKDFL